ncbi:MAG: SulP family inorganic anion transporter [Gammaproteobacteria bacterium]
MNLLNVVSQRLVKRFMPFRGWIHELKDPQVLKADLIAGITVALVLIPQSMAYAQLAGLPPYYGLYASFLPVIIASLMGSSRQVHTGPVAVVSLLTAAALAPFASGDPAQYAAYAVMLALMVGVFQLSLGLLQLGFFVDFLSHPVVVGFTNGAAIIIATSQLGKLFGVTAERAEHHYETVWRIIEQAYHHTHMPTVAFSVAALAIMILLKKFAPKIPGVLTAVVVTTIASWLLNYEQIGGKVVGTIPQGLPGFAFPDIDMQIAAQLLTNAIAIGLIGFTEAISVAKAIAAQTRQRLDANQGLVGQGLANITSSLFQGYAVSGSFSRSAVNLSAGAKTGFAAIASGLLVMVTLLFLTPLLYHLPQPTLAAVIILAVFNLIKFKPIKYAWRVQKHDAIVAMITFILTLLLAPHLELSILVGVVLSMGLYMYRTMRPRIAVLAMQSDGSLADAESNILKTCPKITILRFDGSLFFANTGYFEEKVLERVASKPDLKFIIIDAEGINEIDATGEEMLHQLALRLHGLGIEFLFCRTKKQVMDVFLRTGFASDAWLDHFCHTEQQAIDFAWSKIDGCQEESCPLSTQEGCPACTMKS